MIFIFINTDNLRNTGYLVNVKRNVTQETKASNTARKNGIKVHYVTVYVTVSFFSLTMLFIQ